MTGRGRFVVLEGGEASGKSTQAAILARSLGALLTREPGGTELGERVRALILDPSSPAVSPRAEVLLILAARAQHVAEVILPALSAGRDVVCDRFSGSTVAYQGYGRGLDPVELATMSSWSSGGVEPDRVVLLSLEPIVALSRRAGRAGQDRMEGEGHEFFSRVAAGYASLVEADPVRWRAVDGAGSIDDVARRVAAAAAR